MSIDAVDIPCFKCTDRSVGCHSKCDIYKEWCKERKSEKQKCEDYFQKRYPTWQKPWCGADDWIRRRKHE